MKAEDCKLGMQVIPEGERDSKAVVVELPDAHGDVVVEWYHGTGYARKHTFHVDDLEALDLEADKKLAEKVQEKLDLATSAFEKAFLALQEARKTADEGGIDIHSLQCERLISSNKLEGVMERHGWSSSSLWC